MNINGAYQSAGVDTEVALSSSHQQSRISASENSRTHEQLIEDGDFQSTPVVKSKGLIEFTADGSANHKDLVDVKARITALMGSRNLSTGSSAGFISKNEGISSQF